MGIYDFLSKNPTKLWRRKEGLKLTVDIMNISLNGISIPSKISYFDFLGKARYSKRCLDYPELGISLYFYNNEINEIVLNFDIDSSKEEAIPVEFFAGSGFFQLKRESAKQNILRHCGEPYCEIDDGEYELRLVYESPQGEVQFFIDADDQLQFVEIGKPELRDRKARDEYGITKEFPY